MLYGSKLTFVCMLREFTKSRISSSFHVAENKVCRWKKKIWVCFKKTTWCSFHFVTFIDLFVCLFVFSQLTISGLFLLWGEIFLLDVLLMDSFVMAPGSLYLVEWLSMANILMNYMNYKQADGNGNGWNQSLPKMDSPLVQD